MIFILCYYLVSWVVLSVQPKKVFQRVKQLWVFWGEGKAPKTPPNTFFENQGVSSIKGKIFCLYLNGIPHKSIGIVTPSRRIPVYEYSTS